MISRFEVSKRAWRARYIFHFLIFYMFLFTSSVPSSAQFLNERKDKVHVVFLPGIYGSKLQDPQTKNWHWGEETYGGSGLSLLEFPEFETELMDRARFKLLHATLKDANIYSDFTEIMEWRSQNVHSFHYDWRKSNKKSAAVFDKWLCDEFSKIEPNAEDIKVLFIAHSMGGLVLRHWLKDHMETGQSCAKLTASQINKIVFAGTPHLGSQEAVKSLITGKSDLTESGLFFIFNGDDVVRDAVTFESVYELLPAHNLLDDSCSAVRPDIAQKLQVQLDTGEFIPLRLGDVALWRRLQIPAKQPRNFRWQGDHSYSDIYELISERLMNASEVVCGLLSHTHDPEIAGKFQFVYGTNEEDDDPSDRRDTIDSIKVVPNGELIIEKGLGDKTVSEWSAYPLTIALSGKGESITDFTPVGAQHDQILSDGISKNFIGKMLKQAARVAAASLGEVFNRTPKTKEELQQSLMELGETGLPETNPGDFTKYVDAYKSAALDSGITANGLFEIANGLNTSPGIQDFSAVAIGYAIASEVASPQEMGLKVLAQKSAKAAFEKSGYSFEFEAVAPKIQLDIHGDLNLPEKRDQTVIKLLHQFTDVNLRSADPTGFNFTTAEIATLLTENGFTGPELYEIAENYNGDDRYQLRAFGFAAATKLQGWSSAVELFPAYQDTAHAFTRLNVPNLAAGYGLGAGIINLKAMQSEGTAGGFPLFEERERKAKSVTSWGLSNSGDLAADSMLKSSGFEAIQSAKPFLFEKYGIQNEILIQNPN